MQIKVENTAISNGKSKSLKIFYKYINNPVLDYGAGKLRNAKYLAEEGFKVSVLDIPEQVKRWSEKDKKLFDKVYISGEPIKQKYSTILLTFVLNVIPFIEERRRVLEEINELLEENGVLIAEVRREKGIMNSKYIEPYKDGYILGKGEVRTFQKPYTKEEFVEFISEIFEVKEIKVENDSIIIVAGRKRT